MCADRTNLESLASRQDVTPAELAELGFTDRRRLLLLASQQGSVDIARILSQLGTDLNARNAQGSTPLHIAAARRHLPLLSFLLEHNANVNAHDDKNETPLLNVVRSHADLDCISALVSHGADLWCKNHDSQCCLDYLFQIGLSDAHWLEAISNDLHCGILTRMKSPILFLNKVSEPRPGQQPQLVEFFHAMLQLQDRRALRCLLLWYIALCDAAKHHINSAIDLNEFAGVFKAMIHEVFRCDSMDEPWNVQFLLQPEQSILSYRHQPILKYQLQSLQQDSILSLCIQRECKFIFEISQVGGYIEDLFWRSPRFELLVSPSSPSSSSSLVQPLSLLASMDLIFRCLRSPVLSSPLVCVSYGMRACPGVRCWSDCLSRAFFIYLVNRVTIDQYGASCGQDYSSGSCSAGRWTSEEYLCALFALGMILHAIGDLYTANWSFSKYFRDEWNIIDAVSVFLLFAWLDARDSDISVARVVLSLAAIPLTLGLLRYLNLSRSLGVVVAIARAMLLDMIGFATVYVVFAIGFAIFFQSSFYGSSSFSDYHETFLSLFSFSLGNFSYDIFDTHNERINTLGESALTFFVILTSILLMNLLVARMANAYSRIDDHGREEWSFVFSRLVQRYLLLQEKHSFCMLPVPLNCITAALWPVHVLGLSWGWSLGGTVANVVYHQLSGPLRVLGWMGLVWPAMIGVWKTWTTGWSKTPWVYSLGYLATNLFAAILLLVFMVVAVLCPLAVDVCCKQLPRPSKLWEEVAEGMPRYLLIETVEDAETVEGRATATKREGWSQSAGPGVQLVGLSPSGAEGISTSPLNTDRPSLPENSLEPTGRPTSQSRHALSEQETHLVFFTEEDVQRILRHLPAFQQDKKEAPCPPREVLQEQLAALQSEVRQSREEIASLREEVRTLVEMLKPKA